MTVVPIRYFEPHSSFTKNFSKPELTVCVHAIQRKMTLQIENRLSYF